MPKLDYPEACTIVVPAKQKVGTFVNAFRVLPDTGDELLLDFCIYSQQEAEAVVVSRLRVHKEFLTQIRERLSQTLPDISQFEVTKETQVH